jgi:hypothetical protein
MIPITKTVFFRLISASPDDTYHKDYFSGALALHQMIPITKTVFFRLISASPDDTYHKDCIFQAH